MSTEKFSSKDLTFLKSKGIAEAQVREQLKVFETGYPSLVIIEPSGPDSGIIQVPNELMNVYVEKWSNYLKGNETIVKFVPASGAASRMFKDLFEFLDGEEELPSVASVKEFFEKIENFAFYDALNEKCLENEAKDIPSLVADKNHKAVIANLLEEKGLNYGFLPKGLLLFHHYTDEKRTPLMEHLAEGAMYSKNASSEVNIHFTVSNEHRELFAKHFEEENSTYSKEYNAIYKVSFSEQKPSTDTIAADESNKAFRDEEGQLLFRPGGHGALIENLNDLDADVVFIKNIDNVVPDALKNPTIIYKKVIAGMLIDLQTKVFDYLKAMDGGQLSEEKLQEIAEFSEKELFNQNPNQGKLNNKDLQDYLYAKLNRPIRVCGMVKNTGEPGGGPFLAVNPDGTISTQILESSQIDMNNPDEKAKLMASTHFNPVDLVCAIKDYKGNKFNLLDHVDRNTGFISMKSYNGIPLKALELPGLWNGAMSDWNTVFVEVPISTFNPVKTVNDLLRDEHQ